MKILPILVAGIVCTILSFPCRAKEGTVTSKTELWINNFEQAKKQAVGEGKDILIVFSGSDWCEWCIKLKQDIFSTPEFEATAPKMFVLMEADFPRDTSKIPPEVASQNERLHNNFGVDGKFPAIILVDQQGKPYAKTGYHRGEVTASFLEFLKKEQAVRQTRDASWMKAESAKGVEKAKRLVEGLAGLDDKIVATYYGSVVAEIKKLDPLDLSDFVKKTEYRAKLSGLENSIEEALGETCDVKAATKLIDDFLIVNKVAGEERQHIMIIKLGLYPPNTVENINKALVILDAIVAVDARSETGKKAAAIKPTAEMFKKQFESSTPPRGAKQSFP